jgi:sec-independent protein translocase protein TatB
MFEVSWGEIALVLGVGVAIVGPKDLPKAARFAGTQLGRVVGLLQGARARADRFAAQNELRQLQNELRAGLRELDAVKSELAVSLSPGRGLVGRGLGSMVAGANKNNTVQSPPSPSIVSASSPLVSSTRPSPLTSIEELTTDHSELPLAPEAQTIAAVAEEEWEKQGIAFKSRAERGAGLEQYDPSTSGSAILANLLTQSLVFDQYDRAVREEDRALQRKMESLERQVRDGANKATDGKSVEPSRNEKRD